MCENNFFKTDKPAKSLLDFIRTGNSSNLSVYEKGGFARLYVEKECGRWKIEEHWFDASWVLNLNHHTFKPLSFISTNFYFPSSIRTHYVAYCGKSRVSGFSCLSQYDSLCPFCLLTYPSLFIAYLVFNIFPFSI